MNDAMHNTNKERECRVNGSNANNKMCFEVRAPSSTSPPSPRRISNPLTCLPRTPTEGTSTEAIQMVYRRPEYRTPTIQPIQPPPRPQTPQSTSTEEGYKHQPTPPHLERVNHNLNLYQRGSKPTLQSTSTKERYNKSRRVQQVVYLNHKPNLFPTNK